MTDDAILMLIWRCQGETLVIPMVDSDGNDTLLIHEMLARLPERVQDTARVALLEGVIADQRDIINHLRLDLRRARIAANEAGELAEHYRERMREQHA